MRQFGKLEHDLGTNVRQFRRRQNLTQQMLGDMMGVTRQFVSNVERGRSSVQLCILQDFANALGADPMILLFAQFPDDSRRQMRHEDTPPAR